MVVEAKWERLRASDLVSRLMEGLPRQMAAVVDAEDDFTNYELTIDQDQLSEIQKTEASLPRQLLLRCCLRRKPLPVAAFVFPSSIFMFAQMLPGNKHVISRSRRFTILHQSCALGPSRGRVRGCNN